MVRLSINALAHLVLLAILSVPLGRLQADPGKFLVTQGGLRILDASGEEVERVSLSNFGAISPDGRWLAGVRPRGQDGPIELFIRTWDGAGDHTTVPLVWDKSSGTGIQIVWSADSKRLIVNQNCYQENGTVEYAFRVYNRTSQKTANVSVPVGHWVTGWSPDGSRLLTTVQGADRIMGIAWINFDGTGKPEFVTSENEVAFSAVLSPDGRKILCQLGPKPPDGQVVSVRLYVIDLATKKRTAVDEPGHTHGYCWSPDGKRIAYTWQRPLVKPGEVSERETFLITCDIDGRNRTTVTSRKYQVPPNSSGRDGIIYFFDVLGWR